MYATERLENIASNIESDIHSLSSNNILQTCSVKSEGDTSMWICQIIPTKCELP